MKNFCNKYDGAASSIVSSFVAPSMTYTTNRKMLGGKRVLRERDFVEGLSSVIEKQFFPDLKRLKAQAAGIEYQNNDVNKDDDEYASNEGDAMPQYTAPREGDLDNLDSAQSKLFELAGLIPPSKLSSSPNNHESSFLEEEKPLKVSRISGIENKNEASRNSRHQDNVLTIDEYLSKHTSQDNYEYHKLQEKSIKQHREKYQWAYSDQNKTDTKKMRLLNDKRDPSFSLSNGPQNMIEDKDTSDSNNNNLSLEKNNVNAAIAQKIVTTKNKMKNNNVTTTNVNKRKLGSIRYNATRYEQIAMKQNQRTIIKKQRGTQNYQNSIYGGGDDHYSLVLSSNPDMMSDQSSIRGGASNNPSMYRNGGVPRWGTGTSSIHSSSQSRRISRMGHSAKALALKLLENDRKQKKR